MVIAELAVKAWRNRVRLAGGQAHPACAAGELPLRFHPLNEPPERRQMQGLRYLVLSIISLYWWVVIAQAVMSWLIAFGVINTYNKFVAQLAEVLYRLTEPALRPIRNILPNLGGIDISPIILLLLLQFLYIEVAEYFPY
jgi:YggT family protein